MIYDGTYDSYVAICNMAGIDDMGKRSFDEYRPHTIYVKACRIGIGDNVEFDGFTPAVVPLQCAPSLQQEPKPQHPLLNPESKHYEMIGGVQAIELMESMFTVDELKAWAKLTAMKYRLRIGAKDDPEKEIAKIKTFEAYWKYLDAGK